MRILLDAYFDNNFGDDLFVNILLERYPDDLFYVFWDKEQPRVLARALKQPNLVVMPGACGMVTSMPFDGYVMIGGDVLPDGIDYSRRISWMRHVKENGGFVAMLGFSLYESYGEKTRADLAAMAKLADTIVIRDKRSAERFKMLVPDADVTEATDMAFVGAYSAGKKEKEILGIAPRRKLYSTDEEHNAFCRAMASIADGWLCGDKERTVRFLALSTGEYDDRETAKDIIAMMSLRNRTEVVAHTDGINAFLDKVCECSAMLPTRFHALVFALVYNIPFVPIPYEVKLTQVLDEIGYSGVRIPYGKDIPGNMIQQAIGELDQDQVDHTMLKKYWSKAEKFYADMDRLMENGRINNKIAVRKSLVCEKAAENEHLKAQTDFLGKQVQELSDWVNALKEEREKLLTNYQELDAIRIQQVEQLQQQCQELDTVRIQQVEQLQQQYQELDSVRIQQVEQLQQQYQELDDVRVRQYEQLQSVTNDYAALEQKMQDLLKRFPPAKLFLK